ncbi:hypothetical protein QA601_18460 [Chitinispirillales bacterium ANBcel5]|uniref:ligand-binding sensor domain-containing protein n=1 Tax=Cellulosispirillum alkaliphilum TaxID=3039283 RepID=UPI002A5654B0|nr:hypothetical protein [Chitinispirillales bacterium ANBcel5]
MTRNIHTKTFKQGLTRTRCFSFIVILLFHYTAHSTQEVNSVDLEYFMSYNHVRSLAVIGDTIWGGTEGGGLIRIIGTNNSTLQITTEQGLADNVVQRVILADTIGSSVWVGTDDGISYISGDTVRSYKTAGSSPLGRVRDIAIIGNRMVAASYNAGVVKYRNGQFEQISSQQNSNAMFVTYDSDSTLWALKLSGIFKIKEGEIFEIETPSEFRFAQIGTMVTDTNDHVWIASDWFSPYAARYDGNGWEIFTLENGGIPLTVQQFRINPFTNRLVGVSFEGVIQHTDDQWETIKELPFRNYNMMRDIAFYDSSQFVLTYGTIPVFYTDNNNYSWPHKTWVENNYIERIATDRKNNLWASLDMSRWGVHKYNGEEWTYYSKSSHQLLTNNFTAYAQDSSGGHWFGSDSGFTYMADDYTHRFPMDAGVNEIRINDCIVSRDNILWAATNVGVMRYDSESWIVFDTSSGLQENHVYSITEDEAGTIIVGTYEGLATLVEDQFIADTSTGGPRNLYIRRLKSSPYNHVVALPLGRDGAYLRGNGEPWQYLLGDIRCRDVDFDNEGRIWIAGGIDGVYIMDHDGNLIYHLIVDERLSSVENITLTNDGTAWIHTTRSLISATVSWSDSANTNITAHKVRFPVQKQRPISGYYDIRGRKVPVNLHRKSTNRDVASGLYITRDKDEYKPVIINVK